MSLRSWRSRSRYGKTADKRRSKWLRQRDRDETELENKQR